MKGLQKIYGALYKSYGRQGWWPLSKNGLKSLHYKGNPRTNKDKLEICIGAILTQNTSWSNVEKALYNLNKAKVLSQNGLLNINKNKLASLIKSSGYYNQKAKKIKYFLAAAVKHRGIMGLLLCRNLRETLLAIKGIGPETADSIMLYAAGKPYFVIDAYTKRIMSRLLGKDFKSYDEWQKFFMDNLEKNVNMFKEYHALLVEHAKQHCKTKPVCGECILAKVCEKNF